MKHQGAPTDPPSWWEPPNPTLQCVGPTVQSLENKYVLERVYLDSSPIWGVSDPS